MPGQHDLRLDRLPWTENKTSPVTIDPAIRAWCHGGATKSVFKLGISCRYRNKPSRNGLELWAVWYSTGSRSQKGIDIKRRIPCVLSAHPAKIWTLIWKTIFRTKFYFTQQ